MVEMALVDAKLCAMFPLIGVMVEPSLVGVELLVIDEVVSGFGAPCWVGFLSYGFVMLLLPSVPDCFVILRMLIRFLVVVFFECRHRFRTPP